MTELFLVLEDGRLVGLTPWGYVATYALVWTITAVVLGLTSTEEDNAGVIFGFSFVLTFLMFLLGALVMLVILTFGWYLLLVAILLGIPASASYISWYIKHGRVKEYGE